MKRYGQPVPPTYAWAVLHEPNAGSTLIVGQVVFHHNTNFQFHLHLSSRQLSKGILYPRPSDQCIQMAFICIQAAQMMLNFTALDRADEARELMKHLTYTNSI